MISSVSPFVLPQVLQLVTSQKIFRNNCDVISSLHIYFWSHLKLNFLSLARHFFVLSSPLFLDHSIDFPVVFIAQSARHLTAKGVWGFHRPSLYLIAHWISFLWYEQWKLKVFSSSKFPLAFYFKIFPFFLK